MANTVSQSRPPAATQFALRFRNDSGQTIPPFGVVELYGRLSGSVFLGRSVSNPAGLCVPNGATQVLPDKYGEVFLWTIPRRVRIEGVLSVGDSVGPSTDSWVLGAGGSGFTVVHPSSDLTTAVVVKSGGGGTSTPIIRFEIFESDCEGRSAVARVLSNNGGVPGAYEIYGEVEQDEQGQTVPSKFVVVYDKAGCFLNESNVNLNGRLGYATYLTGRPKYPYQPWTGFEITSLAEQQTECEAF